MAINFDTLPKDNPMGKVEAGTYYATIDKAEMKQPKDAGKKPYLNLTFSLKDKDGKGCGKLFDILSDSEHQVVLYKLQRFVTALGLPITGSFELSDLAKVVTGKQCILDVTMDTKQSPARAVVDVFAGGVYYPMSEAATIFGATEKPAEEVPANYFGETPINAPDAADAPQPTTNVEY